MKTIFSLATLSLLALTSCKKDYTCSCSTTVHRPEFSYQGFVMQEESTTTSPAVSSTIKDKESEAKSACESGNATTSTPSAYAQYGAEPTTTKTTCAIQ